MTRLLPQWAACLLICLPTIAAQEIDPDTLQDVESQRRFDALMLDALPGSSASVRVERGAAPAAARLLLEHPNYRLGYVGTAASPERWWTLLGDTTWMVAVGDIVIQRGLGTLTSAARGMGRSRLSPISSIARRTASSALQSPFRAGIGGLRGCGASAHVDSIVRLHAAWGIDMERPGVQMAMIAADMRSSGVTASATVLASHEDSGTTLSGSVSALGMVGSIGVAAELAIDPLGCVALQCLGAYASGPTSVSLVFWNAHAQAELALGSLLASTRSATNSWGGDLRMRISQRGVATVRLALSLSGTHGRTWLLPLASRTMDVIGDVEQRVTDRLHIEWRVRHRRDEDGASGDVRRQNDRLLWQLRLRVRRIVHDRLEVRCNADLRLLQRQASDVYLNGTLGWVEARWKVSPITVLRFRTSVFASDEVDVAPMMVEYAARGLQTLVSANGYGRRVGMGVEWQLTPIMCVALKAAVETRLRPGEHRTVGELRAGIVLHGRRDDVLRSVVSPEDDMHLPRE